MAARVAHATRVVLLLLLYEGQKCVGIVKGAKGVLWVLVRHGRLEGLEARGTNVERMRRSTCNAVVHDADHGRLAARVTRDMEMQRRRLTAKLCDPRAQRRFESCHDLRAQWLLQHAELARRLGM